MSYHNMTTAQYADLVLEIAEKSGNPYVELPGPTTGDLIECMCAAHNLSLAIIQRNASRPTVYVRAEDCKRYLRSKGMPV
jgi:hypothetical protein